MFERYSEKARRVIFFARYEASGFGSPAVDTEHLLLGILRESQDFLRSVALPAVRELIRQLSPVRDKIPTRADLPFSKMAQNALLSTVGEADRLNEQTILPEHILVGLLQEENSLAQAVLAELGVTLESARHKVHSQHEAESTANAFGMRVTGQAAPNQKFQKVVMDAIEEASLLRSMSAKPEHLLLALLQDETLLAARILREAGLDYDGVRRRLERTD
jgi:ATP-dependent Clp protease ATP-binding subunit ClpC